MGILKATWKRQLPRVIVSAELDPTSHLQTLFEMAKKGQKGQKLGKFKQPFLRSARVSARRERVRGVRRMFGA